MPPLHLFEHLTKLIPFAGLLAKPPGRSRPHLTRLAEQSTVAIIAALTVLWSTTQHQAEQLREITTELALVRAQLSTVNERQGRLNAEALKRLADIERRLDDYVRALEPIDDQSWRAPKKSRTTSRADR